MLKKILGLVLLLLLILSASSSALDLRTGQAIWVPKDKVIQDNLFAAGEKVNIAGTVKGDLMAFAGEIKISGNVEGNIIAAGGEITISGRANNVFIAGGEVMINGVVKRDLLIGGGNVHLSEISRVGRDAYLGCGSVDIAGKIYRNLKVGSGNLIIAAPALIKGELDYSARQSTVSRQAKIFGKVTARAVPEYEQQATKFFTGIAQIAFIVGILTILLLGILIIIFMPNQVKLVTSTMTKEFWKSVGWGILSLIAIPIVVILLFVSLIGFPLGALLLVAYVFGIYIAGIFTSIVIGQWLFKKIGKPDISLIWALIVGFIVFKLLTWIPFVGWLFGLVVFLWAFGALVSTRFVSYRAAREREVL
jgi:cytoskeletal protein CcmA (bactofilin family)